MYNVIILPAAKLDISDAADWYESNREGLAKRFLKEVRRKIGLIEQSPYMYAVRYDDIRMAVLDVFPFMIHFHIEKVNNKVVISAVLHTSRTSDSWKGSV